MALTLEEKKQVVSEVAAVAASAHSAVAAENRGLSAGQLTSLRKKARSSGVYLRVVKNNLARIAVKDTNFESLGENLTGPMVLAFSQEDPGSAARLLRDFLKADKANADKLEVKFVTIDGQTLPGSELERLAKLPTREQALATLAAVLRAPLDKFARTLAALRDQKDGGAPAPAEADAA
ncbi:MAG: 50S ribosomal protein L10 [Thiofilum sp.]|uniref:50S ribosomal protein L10 n=1 Tax=Thiofilum sp. TaxID=2212733 RepID=UPI0025CD98FA|nr:50S ribosomal protein L10 [Thiofilum sp.]MBK8452071.1 50S ribosomal protein L10 [Thiofilum sp.]